MLGRRREAEDPGTGPGTRIRGRHGAAAVTTVMDPMELLSVPLSDGDLTAALARRPKVRLPSLTMTLFVAAVAALGFLGGAFTDKHLGASSSPAASAFSRFAAAAGASSSAGTGSTSSTGFAGRGGGLFGGSGAGTFGTVKLVDGNIVYVQTAAGDIVQVTTSAATKVTISSPGQVKDLLPGETIIVEGSKNANGSVAATSISQPSLGTGGGGGGTAVGIGGSGG